MRQRRIKSDHQESGVIVPLNILQTRLLELLSAGLTVYEVGAILELEPAEVEQLRRQTFLRLGVTNLKDAISASGIEIPRERPEIPAVVKRPERLSKQERKARTQELIHSLFGEAFAEMGFLRHSPIGICWPERLWVVRNRYTRKPFFLKDNPLIEASGLVCFSSEMIGDDFVEALNEEPGYENMWELENLNFDDVRELAKDCPDAQALILANDLDNLHYHYVR